MKIVRSLTKSIAKLGFVKKAIEDRADLSEIKGKPTAKFYIGIFLMAFSYLLGLPAIGVLSALSIYWKIPKLAIIGGPSLFIIAHAVFFAGVYLSGGKYLLVFFRWATRKTLEKLIKDKVT
ncbi:MAG: hypothetical protein QNJ97_08455 [Myxococcota bacterium]|nr:hypothetical protein [Myxococcota bacterium]